MKPTDPTPLTVSVPLKTAVYVGIAGTLLLGIWPKPFIDWAVSATLMFSNIAGPTAAVTSTLGG